MDAVIQQSARRRPHRLARVMACLFQQGSGDGVVRVVAARCRDQHVDARRHGQQRPAAPCCCVRRALKPVPLCRDRRGGAGLWSARAVCAGAIAALPRSSASGSCVVEPPMSWPGFFPPLDRRKFSQRLTEPPQLESFSSATARLAEGALTFQETSTCKDDI